MKIDILTLFPEMFDGPFNESIVKRAQEKNLISIKVRNLRDWATDRHKKVDDKPYGGGAGMVLRVDIIDKALEELKTKSEKRKTILLSAKGEKYTQKKAHDLSKLDHLILVAGHYEGIDHRVHKHLVDDVISIGNYVLTGGEIPAMVLVDSVIRLVPGVLNPESLIEESHSQPTTHNSQPTKEYPQFTRPEVYKGWKVPKVLLSGNHKDIESWRKKKQKRKE